MASLMVEAKTDLLNKVDIVVLQYNAHKEGLDQFNGSERVVTFNLTDARQPAAGGFRGQQDVGDHAQRDADP